MPLMPLPSMPSASTRVVRKSVVFSYEHRPSSVWLVSGFDSPRFKINLQDCKLESVGTCCFHVDNRSHLSFHSKNSHLRLLFCHSWACVMFRHLLACTLQQSFPDLLSSLVSLVLQNAKKH